MTNGNSAERRRLLSVLCSSPLVLAGCLQLSDQGDTDDPRSDRNATDETTDEDDDWSPPEPGDSYTRLTVGPRPHVEHDPAADPPLSLAVSAERRDDEPHRLEIELTNESDEEHTLTLDGFVPFSEPFGEHVEEDDRLVLVPGEDTPTPHAEQYVTDERRRTGSYFAPLEPVEVPETEHEVDLEPGGSVGGTHHLLAVPESDNERPWTDDMWPGEYYFESTVGVPTADATVTVSFGLLVGYVVS